MWANILFPTHFLIESYATSILFKVLLFQNHHFFHNMNGIQTSCLTICDELGTALTFYNLALFSIYGNDGTTISTSGVILNKIISLRKGSRIKPVVGHGWWSYLFQIAEAVFPPKVCYILIWKSNSSYPCIKYDHFLHSKIQRSLAPNLSVIEPNAFSFLTLW